MALRHTGSLGRDTFPGVGWNVCVGAMTPGAEITGLEERILNNGKAIVGENKRKEKWSDTKQKFLVIGGMCLINWHKGADNHVLIYIHLYLALYKICK